MRSKTKFLVSGIAGLLLSLPLVSAFAADWKPAPSTLTTPWTDRVSADKPLPDYPRPQMTRPDWTNLNGLWQYSIQKQADTKPTEYGGSILVPFAIESSLSGVGKPLAPGESLWYRRTFTAPKLSGKHLMLHFGAVDWKAEVFVNGKSVGTHEGGYDPFSYDITPFVKGNQKEQELQVAVRDSTDQSLQPRGKQVLNPKSIWYTAVSGIWQTVWLEPVSATHIRTLTFEPDLDGKRLKLLVQSSNPGQVSAVAKLRGKEVGRVSGRCGQEMNLALKEVAPWSPETPTLYDLDVSLPSGDAVRSYFGMRKVERLKDKEGHPRIALNGKPYFMIGPLDQGWWPDGLYTPPTDEAIQFDLRTLKEMGFNMLRKHVKVEPARYYYWCDKMGIAVWQDFPSAMGANDVKQVKKGSPDDQVFPPNDAADFKRELSAMLSNLHNVPSIVAWVPFNEGWGEHDTNEILRSVKASDSTRLLDGPSGWEDRGFGDLKDMHEYPGPSMFKDTGERVSVLGEFGGLGYPVADHLWWTNKRNWGYRNIKSKEELQSAYEDLIKKLQPLIKSGLSAAIYTQTTDVEGEINGLMTYDRKVVKLDPKRLAAVHGELKVGE